MADNGDKWNLYNRCGAPLPPPSEVSGRHSIEFVRLNVNAER